LTNIDPDHGIFLRNQHFTRVNKKLVSVIIWMFWN